MKRKYDGNTIQGRRHPGQATPKPEAWRLEEERGAMAGCNCWGCRIIRQAVQAELRGGQRRQPERLETGFPLWELEHRARHTPPTYLGPDAVINWDWNANDPGLNLVETMQRLAEDMRAAIAESNPTFATSIIMPDPQRQQANQRAEALLASLLTPEQQEAWHAGYSFTITVPSGNRYQLHASITYQLDEAGRKIASYCLISRRPLLPIADLVASRLLLLQANEELFLRLANKMSLVGGGGMWGENMYQAATVVTSVWSPVNGWNQG